MPASDRKSFVASLAAQYSLRLRRFLSVRLRSVHEIPDLEQEVFLRLLRVERHEAIRNPEAYLFTVASHVVQQHSLSRASDPGFVDIAEAVSELTTEPNYDPATRTEHTARIEQLERVLKQLPPRVAAALVLHRVGGYTVQEVANQLGVARNTAKEYLARAAKHCRTSSAGRARIE